jgi:hypothetical protein
MEDVMQTTRWFRPFAQTSRVAFVLAFAAAGCDSVTAPVDEGGEEPPPPPPAAVRHEITVTRSAITALEPCEEAFTDGDGGEFAYLVRITWPDGTAATLATTSDYPSANGRVQLLKNQTQTRVTQQTRTFESRAGMRLDLTMQATEYDFDLFGANPFPDGRMNNARNVATYVYNGMWRTGTFDLDVRPNAACHLRMRYTISVREV